MRPGGRRTLEPGEEPMTTLLLTLSLLGQARSSGPELSKESATRLEFMKQAVAAHRLQPAGDRNVTYRLGAEPAMRFTNSVGTVSDGTIFFWFDAEDRPVAAVQVYRTTSGSWHQAFSSLSTVPLTAGNVWTPTRAGSCSSRCPECPSRRRHPQRGCVRWCAMHIGFKVEMNLELKTWHNLRPLAKLLVRYGKPDSDVIDGGVFAFVLTTDPEVYLLLEARRGANGLEWQYACGQRRAHRSAASGGARKPGPSISGRTTTRACSVFRLGFFSGTVNGWQSHLFDDEPLFKQREHVPHPVIQAG